MLNKIFSKLKPAQTINHSPAEAAMLSVLASPEKTAQLVAQLESDLDATPQHSARRRLLVAKRDHARLALTRHQIDAERERVTSVLKRDQAKTDQALQAADEAHATATRELKLRESKRDAVVKRLAPLEAERLALEQAAVKRAAEAQIDFDAAIALDNAEAESRAAAKLFEAKEDCKHGALSGPLGLRIAALQREIESHADAVMSAQAAVEQAEKARLTTRAELALIEYDRQAQALLDAYVVQRIAVSAVPTHGRKPGGSLQTVLGCFPIDGFESQVSAPERIVFGGQISAYNQRHLPAHVADSLWRAMVFKPDLPLLMATFEDLPPEPSESTDPEVEKVTEDAV
ncbi:hypothetical protein [Rhodoferax sp.]|uniref:hypothetical protein n=1 Tax=Rhodoferax sp. TaxID=50421 RepID=UPI002623BE85|nr:hypothetical protein [Rhodoferax sp.]MDD3936855.1 hypothetical protein [Rhodoferax sp.]